jgi:DNA-binding NtrC family response regulator
MKKILFVDDDQSLVSVIEQSFKTIFNDIKESLVLLTAPNPLDAMKLLKAHPDTRKIVTDFHMPGMDGISFFKHAQPIAPQAQWIMTSSYLTPYLIQEARSLGMHTFLGKPFSMEQLLEILA